jgi:hypothetical protein
MEAIIGSRMACNCYNDCHRKSYDRCEAVNGRTFVARPAIGGSGTYPSWVLALPARTTIINNAAHDWGQAMIDVAEDMAASVEISGIRFKSGTATHGAHLNLRRTAGGKPLIIHGCWFTHSGDIGRPILVTNSRGLVYRCSFDGGLGEGIPVLHHTGITLKWLGGKAGRSWTTPDTIGAKDTTGLYNFYVEDCYSAGGESLDFDDNSCVVVRRCLSNNSNLDSHGAETSPEDIRHFELYDNAGNPRVGINDYEPDEVGRNLRSADCLKQGRDYYVGVAKPGYRKYTCPHPLRGSSQTSPHHP